MSRAKEMREIASRMRVAAVVAGHPLSPKNEDTRLNHITGQIARRCACTGWIVGPERLGAQSTTAGEAVRTHHLSEPHKSFDWEAWTEANTAKVDVPTAKLRKIA